MLCAILSCTAVYGFADWFTKDYCSRKLFVGQVIMNNKAVASDERYVRVYRGTKELKSGDVYLPSESLTISINDAKPQYVYEVSDGGAKFEKGGCEGRRIADKPKVTLNMPAKGAASASEFEIIIGWATGHEEVRISPAFRLVSTENKTQRETLATKSKSKLSVMSRKKLDQDMEVEPDDHHDERHLHEDHEEHEHHLHEHHEHRHDEHEEHEHHHDERHLHEEHDHHHDEHEDHDHHHVGDTEEEAGHHESNEHHSNAHHQDRHLLENDHHGHDHVKEEEKDHHHDPWNHDPEIHLQHLQDYEDHHEDEEEHSHHHDKWDHEHGGIQHRHDDRYLQHQDSYHEEPEYRHDRVIPHREIEARLNEHMMHDNSHGITYISPSPAYLSTYSALHDARTQSHDTYTQ